MARNPAQVSDTAAPARRKQVRNPERKLYFILQPGTDAAAFKAQIATITTNGKIVLDNMEAGEPKPFVVVKLETAKRSGAAGEVSEDTASVE